MPPTANVFVVFFEAESPGYSLVLVYAEETSSSGRPGESPDPTTGQSAAGSRYAQTFPIEGPQ